MSNQLGAPPVPNRRFRTPDRRPALATDYPVFLLRPPYEESGRRAALSILDGAQPPAGTVVALEVNRAPIASGDLRAAVNDLSLRWPDCPVVVLLRMPSDEALTTATRLAPARFRAVVPASPGMASILRDSLTDTAAFPRDVVEWLRFRSIRLNANQADLIESLFAYAPHHDDVSYLLAEVPCPGRWFQVDRRL